MTKKYKKEKREQKQIAKKRINKLFLLSEKKARENRLDLADRYVEIARKISMRYLIPIPKNLKKRFCKHCYCFLVPNKNCRIRINRGKIIIYCYNCKKYTRIPFKKP